MQKRTGRLSFITMILLSMPMYSQYVHPPQPPQADDFPQPPKGNQKQWRGPAMRGANVQCWSAEPSAPSKPIGGVHGVQTVTVFVPLEDLIDQAHLDRTFRQQDLRSFSAGGQVSDLKPDDLPAGIFVSFKGHPIFKVTKVQYPIQDQYPPLVGPRKTGARLTLNFWHEPTNGECYLYAAIWAAFKDGDKSASQK